MRKPPPLWKHGLHLRQVLLTEVKKTRPSGAGLVKRITSFPQPLIELEQEMGGVSEEGKELSINGGLYEEVIL